MKVFTVRFKIPMLILQAISSDRSAGDWLRTEHLASPLNDLWLYYWFSNTVIMFLYCTKAVEYYLHQFLMHNLKNGTIHSTLQFFLSYYIHSYKNTNIIILIYIEYYKILLKSQKIKSIKNTLFIIEIHTVCKFLGSHNFFNNDFHISVILSLWLLK
jgi:hypothetical protein